MGSLYYDPYVPIETSMVRVYSGFDGSLLYVIDSDAGQDRFGASLDLVPDTNGDQLADLLVGAEKDTGTRGRATLFGFPFETRLICDSQPNSTQVGATLELVGSVQVTANDVVLRAAQLPMDQPKPRGGQLRAAG
ncbi:MAG: hypothetical protein GY711_06935 [bacterium]|nr:hypothetical protein [bacterium]